MLRRVWILLPLCSLGLLTACGPRRQAEVLINPDLVNTPQGAYTKGKSVCDQWCHNGWCSNTCHSTPPKAKATTASSEKVKETSS